MRFYIKEEVFKKFPNLFVAIPMIDGFNNAADQSTRDLSIKLLRESEEILRTNFKSIEDLESEKSILEYFETFKQFGANPKKVKPTHYAMAKRVLEGHNLPDINPVVNIYNAFSLKYLTPFGGEDINKIFGDFKLHFANNNEHWIGIMSDKPEEVKEGDLIWSDDYDVSTRSLNWRQCERTKITKDSTHGYFIMDGFADVNKENILKAAEDFSQFITKNLGGSYKLILLDAANPTHEYDYTSKSTIGIDIPRFEKNVVNVENKKSKKDGNLAFNYTGIRDDIQTTLFNVIKNYGITFNKENISIIPGGSFSDFASPICMQLAGILKRKPLDIANEIVNNFKLEGVEKVDVAGNGYINFYLNKDTFKSIVNTYRDDFGKSDIGKGKKIMIEFGQPNTHKSITIGHVKSAITGLSLSRIFEYSGYDVIKANYFGDIGLYVAKCLWGLGVKGLELNPESNFSVEEIVNTTKHIKEFEKLNGLVKTAIYIGECYSFGNNIYDTKDEDKKLIEDLNKRLYAKKSTELNELYDITRDICIRYQDKFFGDLGVKYDRQYPESEVWEAGLKYVNDNIGNIFEKDVDGSVIFPKKEDKEKFKLHTWVFITQKGIPTYSGKDLGLALKKYSEYPDLYNSIVTTSVEQVAYFKAVIKALTLIAPELEGKYEHIGFGWLLFGNKKTSSRMGKKLGYEDIMQEMREYSKNLIKELKKYSDDEIEEISNKVALGSFKFAILSHEFHKDINYDPESFVSFAGYSAPYILYAYARANSILEKANYVFKNNSFESLSQLYNTEEEIELIKHILEMEKEIINACNKKTTHLLTKYVFNMSELFNRFYNKHNVLNEEDENIKNSRLALIYITKESIKKVLYILGIDTVEKM